MDNEQPRSSDEMRIGARHDVPARRILGDG
jgi:hypothetical protein